MGCTNSRSWGTGRRELQEDWCSVCVCGRVDEGEGKVRGISRIRNDPAWLEQPPPDPGSAKPLTAQENRQQQWGNHAEITLNQVTCFMGL